MNIARNLITNYYTQLTKFIAGISYQEIEKLIDLIVQARQKKNTVYIAGNGGSAATASHFATDIGIGSLKSNSHVRAVSLTESPPKITAISNDLAYAEIFAEQLKLFASKGDLLILISASGNSKNLVRAVEVAEIMGLVAFSLTGFDGGKLKQMTIGRNIHVKTPQGAYGLVEDAHLSICHVITECIRSIK